MHEQLLESLAARIAAIEREHARNVAELERELAALRAERAVAAPPRVRVEREAAAAATAGAADAQGKHVANGTSSRRGLLRTAATVAAATAAAGVVAANASTVHAAPTLPADGTEAATQFSDNGSWAVFGDALDGAATGVLGQSNTGYGVYGSSNTFYGVYGSCSSGNGVGGNSTSGTAVFGISSTGDGIYGQSTSGIGVTGATSASDGYGVYGLDTNNIGVYGEGITGVAGSGTGTGVQGTSSSGTGVKGQANAGGYGGDFFSTSGIALHAKANTSGTGVALKLEGKLQVLGSSVGSTTMSSGTSGKTVTAGAATTHSIITLTPLSNPKVFLWISARAAGSFTISASASLPSTVTIQYLIVN
jgi:hypothetical protein